MATFSGFRFFGHRRLILASMVLMLSAVCAHIFYPLNNANAQNIAPADVLGQTWNESEVAGWRGVWTRIGTSNEFDARFTHPNGTSIGGKLRMEVDRRNVSIFRWNPGTWGICSYIGTFSAGFTSVSGTYQCTDANENWTQPYPWNATILSTRVSVDPPPAGRIQVIAGTYGANCKQPRGNRTAHLSQSCNGRDVCEYVVNYQVIGDPAVGCVKNYIAEWQCGDGRLRQASAGPPEAGFGSKIMLTCNQGPVTPPPPGSLGAPAGYTLCAQENGRCNFSGQRDVAYGANGKFTFKPALLNGVDCNNGVFGDPIFGTVKACYIR